MRLYALNDIIRAVSGTAFDRGRAYQHQGNVLAVEFHEGDRQVTGRVRGSAGRAYVQDIRIVAVSHGIEILGECTCPVGFNCKHVAAVLLEGLSSPEGRQLAPSQAERLDPRLAAWLQQIEEVSAQPVLGDDYPPEVRQRLIYVVAMRSWPAGPPTAHLELHSVHLRKDGSFDPRPRPYDPQNVWKQPRAKFLRALDVEVLKRMASDRARSGYYARDYDLASEGGPEILARVLGSGRCRWGDLSGPSLALAPARPAVAAWELGENGMQRLTVEAEPPVSAVLPMSPPWYVDAGAGACGPLDMGLPDRVAHLVISAPEVPPERAARVARELGGRFRDLGIPPLRDLGTARTERIAPVPELLLTTANVAIRRQRYAPPQVQNLPVGRVGFDYGGLRIGATERCNEMTVVRDGTLVVVSRDAEAEEAAFERLHDLGFELLADMDLYDLAPDQRRDLFLVAPDPMLALLDFQRGGRRDLEAEGWRVRIAEDYPLTLAEAADDWYADVEEGSGIDWFGFELGLMVEGEKLNVLPYLVDILKDLDGPEAMAAFLAQPDDGALYLRLDDDRLLPLPLARIKPMVWTLFDLYRVGGLDDAGRIALTAPQAAELAEAEAGLAALNLRWSGGEALREMGRRLRDLSAIEEVPLPSGFSGALRPYQRSGLDWLQFLRANEFGGILADDMGLGKTVQAIAHVLAEKEAGRLDRPCLVVAPTSLMFNWRTELRQFAPSLRVLTLHGPQRKASFGDIAGHDVVLTTYPLLPRDQADLLAQSYHLVILDEAQVIKNPRAKVTQIAGQLATRHRLCLTGTPMENHLGELWSQFHFLMPGLLGDEQRFRKVFRAPIEKLGDPDRRAFLNRRIRPFLLRRTKEEVAPELPPKSEIVEHVELEGAQRDLYESIRLAMHEKVRREIAGKGLGRSHIVILDALLKLRQVCCDPRLLKVGAPAKPVASAKFHRLKEMLPELIEDGRRILLFSQFTTMLDLIEEEVKSHGIDYVILTGQTRDRAEAVEAFQNGAVPLFLISLKAGGTGLNLTAADTVIHYDPWWNPAVEAQATDRAHRIGQDKPVFVYKLLTVGTVEERIVDLQRRKQALADGVLEAAEDVSPYLDEADLDTLFAPFGE